MITPQLAAFLQEGLSLHVGVRDDRLEPAGARAAAVAVEPGGRHVVVYVPAVAASRILPQLQSNGQLALNVGRPEDDRACQVKGTVIDIRPAGADEHALVCAQWDGFMRQLERIGISRQVASGWTMWPAMAIRVGVTAVFEQTPGPLAGTPLA